MNPTVCMLPVCPHCGAKKELFQYSSGNTVRAVVWSDCKHIYSGLPEVSMVQKCPECGGFYELEKVEIDTGDDISFELGWLSFEDALQADRELCDGTPKSNGRFLITILWAYNDIVREGGIPTPEQYRRFCDAMTAKMSVLDMKKNQLLYAEICREIGEFDKCIELLDTGVYLNREFCAAIKARAGAKDNRAFLLYER